MTVLENVLCGMQPLMRASPVLSLLGIGAGRREEAEAQAKALHLLDFVGLRDAASRPAAALSYGDQRRVEIARALACSPRLLLLDEPAAGMNPSETADLAALLAGLKARGTTILIVEHDLHFLMRLSDWMTVLNFGRVLAEGSPASIRHDPRVVAAYLGSGSTAEAADRPLAGRARVPAVPAATS